LSSSSTFSADIVPTVTPVVFNSMTFAVLLTSENCRKYSSDIRDSKCVVVLSVLHSSVTE
jgi:hypothetical protein